MSCNSIGSILLISAVIRFVLIPGLPFGLNGCIAFFDFLAGAAADVAAILVSAAKCSSCHTSALWRSAEGIVIGCMIGTGGLAAPAFQASRLAVWISTSH